MNRLLMLVIIWTLMIRQSDKIILCCPLLSALNVPYTSHTMSTLLYEIVNLYKDFPDSSITKIKHSQGSTPEAINIPK